MDYILNFLGQTFWDGSFHLSDSDCLVFSGCLRVVFATRFGFMTMTTFRRLLCYGCVDPVRNDAHRFRMAKQSRLLCPCRSGAQISVGLSCLSDIRREEMLLTKSIVLYSICGADARFGSVSQMDSFGLVVLCARLRMSGCFVSDISGSFWVCACFGPCLSFCFQLD